MAKTFPALDVFCGSSDLVLAMADDFSPTAVEERDDAVRVFFSSAADRDAARFVFASRFSVAAVNVADEDWARRSQENLQPITIGRLTIFPAPQSPVLGSHLTIVIEPSMAFGTGHHATTRMCLEALQTIDLTGATVVDAGTGSGIVAIAAAQLGAALSFGIDNDPDAIQCACRNLVLNPGSRHASFAIGALESAPLPLADVICANLTGALLVRAAAILLGSVRPGGVLILSGLHARERDDVVRAFAPAAPFWERSDGEWVAVMMKKA